MKCNFSRQYKYCNSFFNFSYLRQLFRNLFHKQGFTYDYVFDWNIVKFGGTRPESDTAAITGNAPNSAAQDLGKERKSRHQRSATGMQSGAVPGPAGAGDVNTPKLGAMQQMIPPDVPFSATQQPAVSKYVTRKAFCFTMNI